MKCLVLINLMSGNGKRLNEDDGLFVKLRRRYQQIDVKEIREKDGFLDIKACAAGYDAVAVCGGDGTFHHALNALNGTGIDLTYVPCGTLNDAAHTLGLKGDSEEGYVCMDLGELNGTVYSYVAATGTFTPIGYLPRPNVKRIFGRLVYYFYAFKEYRRWFIPATVLKDGERFESTYTLIMAVNSRYVFGFPFNRAYRPDDGKGYLLLIDTPRGPLWWVTMFFRFFRAFFIGFGKEYRKKHMQFLPFERLTVTTDCITDYCVDGERYKGKRESHFRILKQEGKILK